MTPASKWLAMPSIRVFDEVDCSKGQAMKVLEEAAWILGAWKEYEGQQNDYWRNSDVMAAMPDATSAEVETARVRVRRGQAWKTM